uniref:Protein rolling stone n=1 Tax=Cacopsylla melanoneura TaxID=428564 RepID=A0A8D8RQ66_9HEMI
MTKMVAASCWTESLYPKIKQAEDFSPDQFYKSQWQKKPGVSIYFLVYRWVTAALLAVYAVATIFEKEPLSRPSLVYPKYPIYLTNWVVWMCAVQAMLGTGIVTFYFQKLRNSKHADAAEAESILVQNLTKVYWATQTIAIVSSIAVSVVFWVGVYNPDINPLNVFTFTSHGLIAAYLVVDALIVAHPFRLSDFLWVFVFSATYIGFSLVYFLLGGTDRFNRNFIYSILDWQDPWSAFLTSAFVILFQLFIHLVVWCLTYSTRNLAHYLYNKDSPSSPKKVETVIDIIDTEAPPPAVVTAQGGNDQK